MTPAVFAGALLALAGAIFAIPGLTLIGLLTLVVPLLARLWGHRGLDGVSYERRLARDRAVIGDEIALTVDVVNRKLLPLAWLRADDHVTTGAEVSGTILSSSERPGYSILRNVWTLGPYERVRRTFRISATHRGRFTFDAVRLEIGDLFGGSAMVRDETTTASYLVRPRSVPVRSARGTIVPAGTRPARLGLIEDPTLFAGVRPFRAGDPLRRIHQRASARVGRPVSKRFDPSIARSVVIVVDMQTMPGPVHLLQFDPDLVEALAVAALSLARRLISEGAACGLALNTWTYALTQTAFLAPHGGHEQVAQIADLLARASSIPSTPLSRVLAEIPGRVASGTLVLVLSSRDLRDALPAMRRLRSIGLDLRHVAIGGAARAHVAAPRRLGIDSVVATLEPDWRTAAELTLRA